jgi:hypothetical protein
MSLPPPIDGSPLACYQPEEADREEIPVGQKSKRRRLRAPSPAMMVALIALFVALGGTAGAAILITGKQIKNGSVTGVDIKNKSLTPKDFRGSVQGPQGPQGPQGAQGLRGPSDVYEHRLIGTVNGASSSPPQVLSLTLSNLPAGSYAIFGKALIAKSPPGTGEWSADCTLTAGSGATATSDRSLEPIKDTRYGHVNTHLVHTFTGTGSVVMACTVLGPPGQPGPSYTLGDNTNGDTRIIAVKVDSATRSSGTAT